MSLDDGRIFVRRASVIGRRDAVATRRDAEALLGEVPDREAGAVLCLRRISLPAVRRGRSSATDDGRLAAEVDRLRRTAARPDLGAVPAQAESVLFRNRGEMLACLARDSLGGLLNARWWWHLLLDAGLPQAAERLWIAEARHVPVALQSLARTRQAPAFLRLLGDSSCRRVAAETIRVHGLTELAAAPEGNVEARGAQALARPQASAIGVVRAKIISTLPEIRGGELSPAQQRLLAIGLALARMPQLVRTPEFAAALPMIPVTAASVLASDRISPAGIEGEPIAPPPVPPPAIECGLQQRRPHAPRAGDHPPKPDFADVPRQGAAQSRRPQSRDTAAPLPQACAQQVEDATQARDADGIAGSGVAIPTGMPPFRPAIPLQAGKREPAAEDSAAMIVTGFGGVFFLANAALTLGLYADFSRPLDAGLDLPFWDFMALAAEGLAGNMASDPAWPVFAELAGRRPDQPAGGKQRAPDAWRMPLEWCGPFAARRRPWRWQSARKRLQVWHGAGFVVVDVPRDRRPAARQLAAEMAPYRTGGALKLLRDNGLTSPAADGWLRWRDWLLPYLERRLALALGTRSDTAVRRMLRLPARVVVGGDRVEVHMRLADLPIAVRLAGLDRNTGWIPAAGRSVDFVFEVDDAAQD